MAHHSHHSKKKFIVMTIVAGLLVLGTGTSFALTQLNQKTSPSSQTSQATSKTKTAETVASLANATKINLADLKATDGVKVSSNTVTITKAGTYELSGSMTNGQVIVDATDDAKVTLVLNAISLSNSSDAAILVKSADKVTLQTVKNTTNTIKSQTTSQDNTAAIFSHDDLTLSGSGKLVVDSSQTGIQSKDTLEVNGGIYQITAKNDGLKGKDEVQIYNGTINVDSQSDGIKATNDTESGKGNVVITGGTLIISGQSQAIKAVNDFQMTGGKLTLTSANEGIEATTIKISGGDMTLTAQEDGLNASSDTNATGSIEITSGNLTMKAGLSSTGDVFDVNNGSLKISGGTINITSPSNPGDYSTFDADDSVSVADNIVTVDGTKITSSNISQYEGMQGGGGPNGGGRGF